MPYIKQNDRYILDKALLGINELIDKHDLSPGDLNYLISKIMNKVFAKNSNYDTIAAITSSLENGKLEFYRRTVALYEDEKIKINGDI